VTDLFYANGSLNPTAPQETFEALIAGFYDRAASDPNDPKVKEAYQALGREIDAQHAALEAAGFQLIPWDKPGQPYANSQEMRDDVLNNKRLYYFKTTEGTTPHPLMPPETNDKFRAVHDFFGHAMGGNSFGPNGELAAFVDHSQTFTEKARGALATDTLVKLGYKNAVSIAGGLRGYESSKNEK